MVNLNCCKPLVDEYATKKLLRFSSCGDHETKITQFQDCSLSATSSIVSSLLLSIRSRMRVGLAGTTAGQNSKITIGSLEECMQKILKRRVMTSSARQAVAGFITSGAVQVLDKQLLLTIEKGY